jgi:hypothetical protein
MLEQLAILLAFLETALLDELSAFLPIQFNVFLTVNLHESNTFGGVLVCLQLALSKVCDAGEVILRLPFGLEVPTSLALQHRCLPGWQSQ